MIIRALRTILGWVYFVWAFVTHFFMCVLFIKPWVRDVESATHFACVPFLSWGATILGIKVRIKGVENIPKDGRFIIASNHQSILDIAVFNIAVKRKFSYLAKQELLKVPFLGKDMIMMGHFIVDRKNPKKAMRTMAYISKKIQEDNYSVLIFPEGTRSVDGTLGEFKRGAFMLAAETGTQIIPAIVDGGCHVVNKSSWIVQGGVMTVSFGKPISVDKGNSKIEIKGIAEKLAVSVKAEIETLLHDARQENN